MNNSRSADSAMTTTPLAASDVEAQRCADGDEEDDEHRQRAALDGRLQRVALSERQVLDDETGGHRGQQRLELLRAAHLAEQRTDARGRPA